MGVAVPALGAGELAGSVAVAGAGVAGWVLGGGDGTGTDTRFCWHAVSNARNKTKLACKREKRGIWITE